MLVSVPNQMPKRWFAELAVHSATIVGIVEAAFGVVEANMPAELWSVLTSMPGPNKPSTIDCRVASLTGVAPITDCAAVFWTKGAANAGTQAVRPSSATMCLSFMYGSGW